MIHRFNVSLSRFVLVALLLQTTLAVAWGQSLPPTPGAQIPVPGALDSSLQKNFQENQPQVDTPKGPTEVKVRPPADLDSPLKLPSFKLEEIQIRNATLLTREELAPIIGPLIGQTVTEDQIMTVTRKITEIYHQKGYQTSRAILPSQKVSSGIVVIVVQESRLGKLAVKGAKHVKPDWVLSKITVKPEEIFNVKQLEADLNKLQRDPHIRKIRADIKPGEKPGTNDTDIIIEDTTAYHVIGTIDNTGRETVGQIHYNSTLVHNNFLNLGHQLILSYTGASGTHSGIAQYTVPLNDKGWNVGARASMGKTLIGGSFDFLDLVGRSDALNVFTNFPLVRKEKLTVTGDLGFNAKVSNMYLFQDIRLTGLEQNIQSVTAGLTWQGFDKLGRWTAAQHADWNIGDQTHFLKVYGSLARWFNLPLDTVLILKAEGQHSEYNLPGLEQMQVGGANTVRGYPEGFRIGDRGYVFSTELHLPFWGFPKAIKNNMEWLLFAESGSVTVSDIGDEGVRGSPGNLLSYGFGFRGRIGRYLTGRLDVGFAQRTDSELSTGRIHFGVTGYPF